MTRLGVWYDFRNPARWRVPWPQLYRETMDQAAYAEELGFASIWVSEHHFSEEGYLPSLSAVLGALAERTSRARLGTAVLLAPLHHPLRLAEDLAVIDQLSGGRLDVGLAPGYKPDEFAVLGVPKSQRGARTDETIEILQLAWRGEPFSYAGRHFRFDDVVVGPPPAQQPGPPIWVGGNSLAAARRAARYGVCFMPDSGAGLDLYDAYRAGLAPAAGPPRVATNRVLFAAASRDEAWEICGDHFLYQFNAYRQWFSAAGDDDTHGAALTDPAVLSPGALLRRHARRHPGRHPGQPAAARVRGAGLLGPAAGHAGRAGTASLELIAKHVLPALQEAAG